MVQSISQKCSTPPTMGWPIWDWAKSCYIGNDRSQKVVLGLALCWPLKYSVLQGSMNSHAGYHLYETTGWDHQKTGAAMSSYTNDTAHWILGRRWKCLVRAWKRWSAGWEQNKLRLNSDKKAAILRGASALRSGNTLMLDETAFPRKPNVCSWGCPWTWHFSWINKWWL